MVPSPDNGFYHKQNEDAKNARTSMRERVDALKENETDAPHESPIYDLAKTENECREDLDRKALPEETLDKLASILPEEEFNKLSLSNVLSKKDVPEMANKFSNQILENLETKKEGRYDGLTKLRNRRSLEKDGIQILSESKRQGKPCSILMMDIDHFKKINDTYGHSAGDEVLKNVAHTIKRSIRQSDWAFRYGGEEFVLILPNTTTDAAEYLAEKIRKEIEKTITDQIKQTISIGIADTEQLKKWKDKEAASKNIGEILKQLLKKADTALYAAKHSGRNQVKVFENEMKGKEEELKN